MTIPIVFPANHKQSLKSVRDQSFTLFCHPANCNAAFSPRSSLQGTSFREMSQAARREEKRLLSQVITLFILIQFQL